MEIAKDVLNYTGETYKKFIIDNEHYISIDSDNQIKTIYNAGEDILADSWDDNWGTTEEQYKKTGSKVLEMLNLSNEYKLVKSKETSVDYWFLSYRKIYSNGLVNENEGFNLTVARANNSIAFLSLFNMPANTLEAEISQEQALEKAQAIIGKLNGKVNNVKLKYVQPNFFWTEGEFEPANFVRLAYHIQFNENYFIDIDGVTGEIIGGDKKSVAEDLEKITSVASGQKGNVLIKINGIEIKSDVAPEIRNSRTMVPLRFLAEIFGFNVSYDN